MSIFLLYSSTKSENRRTEQVLWGRRKEGDGTSGREEMVGKAVGG
jgi:hypothetical protein